MTTMQIVSLVVFLVAVAWVYGRPLLTMVPKKPALMRQIEQVVSIRDTYHTPEVTDACNALLHVLLGVKR